GLATSRILELHGERMIKRTFAPGFRIRLHQKALNLALQAGRDLGVALPNTASTQQLFAAVAAAGGAGLDHSGLVKALETVGAHTVAEDACPAGGRPGTGAPVPWHGAGADVGTRGPCDGNPSRIQGRCRLYWPDRSVG